MLDLSKYQSIAAALKDALDKFADETCLIESIAGVRRNASPTVTSRGALFCWQGRCRMLVSRPVIELRSS